MNDEPLTIGSLFDGSGGFCLGASLAGIQPIWGCEVEPFPIRVTTKRMPFVKHYGDVSEMDGGKVEPVDLVTFGSPCQDMSVAGRREGLDGSRSNLFYQAVRIIKEMRDATDGRYPKYAVWENVPGAFSSSGGEDFRAVLEAMCSIKDETVSIPKPDKRWSNAGEIVGDDYSIAWRVLDAQYWGVPQRRKRIFLVADFTAGRAGEILFESEGLSGYSAEGFRPRQGSAGSAADRSGTAGLCLNDQGGQRMDVTENVTSTLRAQMRGHPPLVLGLLFENNPSDARYNGPLDHCPTICARYGTGGDNQPLVVNENPIPADEGKTISGKEVFNTLCANIGTKLWLGNQEAFSGDYFIKDSKKFNAHEHTVRRLTPTECARLQGFPDWWCSDLETEEPTDEDMAFWRDVFETHREVVTQASKPKTDAQIKKWLKNPHSDSAEYKMWGNGVALPCVYFVLAGIVWSNDKEQQSVSKQNN